MAYLSEKGVLRPGRRVEDGSHSSYVTRVFTNHTAGSVSTNPYWALYPTGNVLDYNVGYDIPGYHKRKASGELLPYTQWLNVRQHSIDLEGYLTTNYNKSGSSTTTEYFPNDGGPFLFAVHEGAYPYDIGVLNSLDLWLEDKGIDLRLYVQTAASSLYSRGWDALTFLSEFHKTVGLVRSAINRLRDLMANFEQYYSRLSKTVKARQTISALLQQWLEFRYGWRLLLYDIQDINKALKDLKEKSRTRNKQRVGANFSWVDDMSTYREFGSSIQTYTDVRHVDLSVRGSIIADFMPAEISINPFITLEEVIPYSFVIDWFWNIGQSIAAISFLVLNSQYTSAAGIYCDVRRTGSLDLQWKTYFSGTWKQEVNQEYTIIKRVPMPVSITPMFNNRFDIPKAVDLLGLLDGFFRGALRNWSIR
jgi:hypothetical protein